MTSQPLLINSQQICQAYGICRSTLWRLSQHPDFPAVQNVTFPRRWNAEAIRAFFDQGLTTQQIIAHYQITRGTWWKWRQLPGFPEALLPGRLARWDLEAVDAFMRKQRKRRTPATTANTASARAAL